MSDLEAAHLLLIQNWLLLAGLNYLIVVEMFSILSLPYLAGTSSFKSAMFISYLLYKMSSLSVIL